jgi:hypothetical protein
LGVDEPAAHSVEDRVAAIEQSQLSIRTSPASEMANQQLASASSWIFHSVQNWQENCQTDNSAFADKRNDMQEGDQ